MAVGLAATPYEDTGLARIASCRAEGRRWQYEVLPAEQKPPSTLPIE